jgi:hypothetical protein
MLSPIMVDPATATATLLRSLPAETARDLVSIA